MKISFEAESNPGPNAKFVADLRIEKNDSVWGPAGWWGLWLTFWLYPRRRWRDWMFSYVNYRSSMCREIQLMICGFEVTWQTTPEGT